MTVRDLWQRLFPKPEPNAYAYAISTTGQLLAAGPCHVNRTTVDLTNLETTRPGLLDRIDINRWSDDAWRTYPLLERVTLDTGDALEVDRLVLGHTDQLRQSHPATKGTRA